MELAANPFNAIQPWSTERRRGPGPRQKNKQNRCSPSSSPRQTANASGDRRNLRLKLKTARTGMISGAAAQHPVRPAIAPPRAAPQRTQRHPSPRTPVRTLMPQTESAQINYTHDARPARHATATSLSPLPLFTPFPPLYPPRPNTSLWYQAGLIGQRLRGRQIC